MKHNFDATKLPWTVSSDRYHNGSEPWCQHRTYRHGYYFSSSTASWWLLLFVML